MITCHANADWDALAAVVGASLLYPGSVLVFPGSMERPISAYFEQHVQQQFAFGTMRDINPESIERLVLVDTSLQKRLPHIAPLFAGKLPEIHVWDHHPPTEDSLKAQVSHIQSVGSTSTLICQQLEKQGIVPPEAVATLLGLGIYSDTGSFTYLSTCPADFRAASWLLACGMNLESVAQFVQSELTSQHVKVLNDLIDNATVQDFGGYTICISEISPEVGVSDFATIVQRFMEMEAYHVLFALASMEGRVQVVARSKVGAIDVGVICKALGGGGHKSAASASVRVMMPTEIKDLIVQQLYRQAHPNRVAKELMSSPAVSLEHTQSIQEAVQVMTRYGLKAAPVVRAGSRACIGLIDAQTASKAATHGLGSMNLETYMQRGIHTVGPDADLRKVMDIIIGERQRLVPVVEDGALVGVVTRTDLINMFVKDQSSIPLGKGNAVRERNLIKTIESRVHADKRELMRRIGALGDTLGMNVFAVGGFVRDLLLARPDSNQDDMDLVVEGDGIEFARALAGLLDGRVREHRAFLTAVVIYDAEGVEKHIDVATARLEYYISPAALPTVELSSIKMDLFRRDFTINAMAIRLNAACFGNLVDFFNGRGDISRKTIRVLHALSFVEDPTRILRAVRFAKRYGLRISEQTERLIKNALELKLMDKVSGTRIMHEFDLLFAEAKPVEAVTGLQALGILAAIHPQLVLNEDREMLLTRLGTVLEWYRLLYMQEPPKCQDLYLLGLVSMLPQTEVESVLERLDLNRSERKAMMRLRADIRRTLARVNAWPKEGGRVSAMCEVLSPLPLEALLYLMARAEEEETSRCISLYINRWSQMKADIDGADLIGLGLTPGPAFAEILRTVLAAKLDGEAPGREEQLQMAQELAGKHLGPGTARRKLDG